MEQGMAGDAYTFIALERTSKLVVACHPGKRDRVNTEDFVSKIRWATAPGWFDVSTDAFRLTKAPSTLDCTTVRITRK
jgi:hypothetical protein